MIDDERDGAPVRVNRGSRLGWFIGLLIAVGVVFGILATSLREIISNPPSVGHEHEHQEGGGGAPPPGGPGGPGDVPGGGAAGHSADDGHGHG
jgi:hypothetical protein